MMQKKSNYTSNGSQSVKKPPKRIKLLREKRPDWYQRAKAVISAIKKRHDET